MPGFLENALAPSLPLDGDWTFSLAGSPPRPIPVPSAWEVHVVDKRLDGPAHYHREFELPDDWLAPGQSMWFEADAVSFHVTVSVNGKNAGTHAGLWSAFQLDVSELLRPGVNTIALEVWKPGDTYPLRETLSGFLPDVITAFGGPWQSLRLRCFSAALADLRGCGVGRMTWADYLVEVQYCAGCLWVSSLRFEGGLGSQPAGFDANPWGARLLAQLLAEGPT